MQKKEIKRGDLFYYDFGEKKGSIQSGVRPVLVVQADCYNQNAPTVIGGLSVNSRKEKIPSIAHSYRRGFWFEKTVNEFCWNRYRR